MGERRRNRRTDERRAREAAEAKSKKEVKTIDKIKKDPAELSTEQMAQLAQAALARAAQSELIKCEIKSELPETTTPTLAPPAPTQTKQMPQLTPAPHLSQLVDIKTEHTTPPQQQQDKSPFHPVNSSRGEQTTTTPTTSSNPASFGRFSQMETNEGQYAHVMSQYIPGSAFYHLFLSNQSIQSQSVKLRRPSLPSNRCHVFPRRPSNPFHYHHHKYHPKHNKHQLFNKTTISVSNHITNRIFGSSSSNNNPNSPCQPSL